MTTKDNLPQADGTPQINTNKVNQETDITVDTPSQNTAITDSKTDITPIQELEKASTIEESTSEIQAQMDNVVAENSEDDSVASAQAIEKKDYHTIDKEALVAELAHLIKTEKVQAIKDHVEEIKTAFNAKYNEEIEEKKEEFLAQGGNIIDFFYSTPTKKAFNTAYFEYKEKRNTYYSNLTKDLQANLTKRLALIEELKGLLNADENINTTYTHFKDIRERWRNAGSIPKDKYNTVWNTYHHHTENFYDFLHLNREFRDLDFKHNLEQKLKIIERATELAQEKDVNRAFRELQVLHKMWKEDLGPVGKEYREDIWEKFSQLTKQIHDNRQEYFKEIDKIYENNLIRKNEIIAEIITIGSQPAKNHSGWQQKIREIETLRAEFFAAGKVPIQTNEKTWNTFKNAVRDFNRAKNVFYKVLKKEQFENLNQKLELIKTAEEHKDSDDFAATTPIMKKIQSDWKKIGHVPRKDSDRIWKTFKAACNHYFDKINAEKNQASQKEDEALVQKEAHIESLKTITLAGDQETDLKTIQDNITLWNALGKVPARKRNIETAYYKVIDGLFDQLDLDRSTAEMIKYENKLNAIRNQEDNTAIQNEYSFVRKKIDEVSGEINQLENNLLFFKHAKADNPMVADVHKNIEKHKESLAIWKAKLKKVKTL